MRMNEGSAAEKKSCRMSKSFQMAACSASSEQSRVILCLLADRSHFYPNKGRNPDSWSKVIFSDESFFLIKESWVLPWVLRLQIPQKSWGKRTFWSVFFWVMDERSDLWKSLKKQKPTNWSILSFKKQITGRHHSELALENSAEIWYICTLKTPELVGISFVGKLRF